MTPSCLGNSDNTLNGFLGCIKFWLNLLVLMIELGPLTQQRQGQNLRLKPLRWQTIWKAYGQAGQESECQQFGISEKNKLRLEAG
jgi:hypothetical protein